MNIIDRDNSKPAVREFLKGDRILICYASQTGSAKAIAETIYKQNSSHCDLFDMASLSPNTLTEYGRQVFVTATYGNGEPPTLVGPFFRTLCESSVDMTQVVFSILALGDKQFLRFCGFGHALFSQFARLGARSRLPITEVNRNDQAVVEHWYSKLYETYNLIALDNSLDWTIATVMESNLHSDQSNIEITLYIQGMEHETASSLTLKIASEDTPSTLQLPVVSSIDEPFIRVVLSIPAGNTQDPNLVKVLQSTSGDKWQIKINQ